MSIELPAPHFPKGSLEKLVSLTWHPGWNELGAGFELLDQESGNLRDDPASLAHLLGGLGQLAQHVSACFLHLSNESNTYLKVCRC